jgi:hypothetical protein
MLTIFVVRTYNYADTGNYSSVARRQPTDRYKNIPPDQDRYPEQHLHSPHSPPTDPDTEQPYEWLAPGVGGAGGGGRDYRGGSPQRHHPGANDRERFGRPSPHGGVSERASYGGGQDRRGGEITATTSTMAMSPGRSFTNQMYMDHTEIARLKAAAAAAQDGGDGGMMRGGMSPSSPHGDRDMYSPSREALSVGGGAGYPIMPGRDSGYPSPSDGRPR